MAEKIKRTAAEQHVFNLFLSAAYQANGCCMNPRCETPRVVVLTAGRSPRARVCLVCFEFDFRCQHPTPRRLAGMAR